MSHRLENVLGNVRDRKLIPDPFNVDVMLKAADRLRKLIENIDGSNDTNNSELCDKLDTLLKPVAAATKDPATIKKAAASTRKPPAKKAPKPKSASTRAPRKSVKQSKSVAKSKAEPETVTVEESASNQLDVIEHGLQQACADVSAQPPKPTKNESSGADVAPRSTNNAAAGDATVRVSVRVLDRLMNLAGELVLSRNQLLRVLGEKKSIGSNIEAITSGLDQVTTELQETIMQTRMQPIGNVFNKFPRVIRDLSASLGKNITLIMEGNEVETDKTIVEAIADPLTHLIRNSCDHGIESPERRASAGKPVVGTVVLKAFHQAGKVMIEITDDGAGMNPHKLREKAVEKGVITAEAGEKLTDRDVINLIFAPGFSTAEKVTDVSGRGVGMDVVRTNIEKIGGSVEIDSRLGYGSTIRITLPLTLAIVPSMIVEVEGVAYAIPQSNIVELVQTGGLEKRIERVSNAEVLRLRGSLLPLARLDAVLHLNSFVKDNPSIDKPRKEQQLVVVESGRNRFALAVNRVLDSEEIVVKPLGRHLSSLPLLAGSTILGDGCVAMILDVSGIAQQMSIQNDSDGTSEHEIEAATAKLTDLQRMVLLSVSQVDHFAVSMDIVSRIERVRAAAIDRVGVRKVLQYRGGTLPLLEVNEVVSVDRIDETEFVHIVVFKVYGHEVGLIAPYLDDIRDCDISMSNDVSGERGIAGVSVIAGKTMRILDLYGMTEIARPDWFARKASTGDVADEPRSLRILVCEDSPFFRNFLVKTLVEQGHKVSAYEHGEEGWSVLTEHANDFDLLLTDVEMPELDGIELTRRVRADGRFKDLPIIALTSLADEVSVKRGMDAGVNDYQVKMNKPELLASIARLTQKVAN